MGNKGILGLVIATLGLLVTIVDVASKEKPKDKKSKQSGDKKSGKTNEK